MTLDRSIADDDMIARSDSIVATDLDGEAIIMNVESGKYIHLDDIGTDVFTLVESPASFGAVVRHLCKTYDVSEDLCREQTSQLIEQLAQFEILVVERS